MNEDWVVTRDLHVISKKNTPILFILTCFKTSNSERRVLHRMKSDVGKSHLQLNNGAGACLLSLSHATPFPSLSLPIPALPISLPAGSFIQACTLQSWTQVTEQQDWNGMEQRYQPVLALRWLLGLRSPSSLSGLKICMCVFESFWAVSRLQ